MSVRCSRSSSAGDSSSGFSEAGESKASRREVVVMMRKGLSFLQHVLLMWLFMPAWFKGWWTFGLCFFLCKFAGFWFV